MRSGSRVNEELIEGPFDGPRRLAHDGETTRWAVTAARAAAEIDAHARLAAHPLAIPSVTRDGDVLVFPRSQPLVEIDDALDALVAAAGSAIESQLTVRAFLHALGGPVDAVRGLGRAELSRSLVDRFLGRTLDVRTPRGVDLGGVMPGALRILGARPCAISVRHGRVDGWPVLDLASLALRANLDGAAAHASIGGDDDAFDIALAHQAMRELAAERDELRRVVLRDRAREIVERFVADIPRKPRRLFAFEPKRERRRRLFSRFFDGIRYDDEGLFSSTPEAIASRFAEGLSGTVVDATCGIGSISIALARAPRITRVIAIDRSAERIAMAEHNAGIYGVRDRIELRVGDAIAMLPALRFDALVVDPPWGGRSYDRDRTTLADLPMLAPFLGIDRPMVWKLPPSFDASTLPDFAIEDAVDERGVLKMRIARRGVRVERIGREEVR